MFVLPEKLRPLQHRLLYLVERYRTDRCRDTAAALTYVSLFALVPLLTVLYTMASIVPAFKGLEANIQQLIFENLIPETSAGLNEYLTEYSRQARNLTGFGIAFLIATAVLMLRNIEQAFNHIWRTGGNRGAVASFLLYWAVLSLAPITIGLGLAVSTFLASFATELEQWDIIGIGEFVLRAAPYLLQALGFTLVYAAVPNCRVSVRHAAVGGVLAALSFNVARALFTKLVAGSSITFIYGAFAAVPLFLLWIFISWNIVLVAAIVVHSLSAYQSAADAQRPMMLKALELLEALWQRQASGHTLGELEILRSRSISLDAESWGKLRDMLLEHRVITQDDSGRFLLARDLSKVRLWELQDWLEGKHEVLRHSQSGLPAWEQRALTLLTKRREDRRAQLNLSLGDLFAHSEDDLSTA